MTTYLIVYGTDPSDRLAAYAFTDREQAVRASVSCVVPSVSSDGKPGVGGCALVVETENDITLSKAGMVVVARNLSGGGPAHVSDRASGAKRLLEVLAKHAQPIAAPRNDEPAIPTMQDRARHEAWMCDHAELYIACAYRGPPKVYDKMEANTLDEALEKAKSLYSDRPVLIYACVGPRQVHIGNYDPKEGFIMSADQAATKRNRKSENGEAEDSTKSKREKLPDGTTPVPQAGSKRAAILHLITRSDGATADDLRKATGWAEARGTAARLAMAHGKTLERIEVEGQPNRYRLTI